MFLGIAALAALGLAALRQWKPYAFIADFEEVPVNTDGLGVDIAYYCRQANYEQVCERAGVALLPLGFEKKPVRPGAGTTIFAKGFQVVGIFKDAKIKPKSALHGGKQFQEREGWVTVLIQGQPEPTLWQKVRGLAGLG